jgi:hypothetical protein
MLLAGCRVGGGRGGLAVGARGAVPGVEYHRSLGQWSSDREPESNAGAQNLLAPRPIQGSVLSGPHVGHKWTLKGLEILNTQCSSRRKQK